MIENSRTVHKTAAAFFIHGKAHNVGREHIRRKLNAPEGKPHGPAQRDSQSGLAHAGYIVQQDMPFRQHRHQNFFCHLPFAGDYLFNFPEHVLKLWTNQKIPLKTQTASF